MHCGLTSQGQLIAVKQVSLDASDPDAAKREYSRLQGEVELLKTLRHSNIVGFLGTSLNQHVVSIFMEYIPGGSIASILHRLGWSEIPSQLTQKCLLKHWTWPKVLWVFNTHCPFSCLQVWSFARACSGSIHPSDPGRGGLPAPEQGDSSWLERKQRHADAHRCHQAHRLWLRPSAQLSEPHSEQQWRSAQICPRDTVLDGTGGRLRVCSGFPLDWEDSVKLVSWTLNWNFSVHSSGYQWDGIWQEVRYLECGLHGVWDGHRETTTGTHGQDGCLVLHWRSERVDALFARWVFG